MFRLDVRSGKFKAWESGKSTCSSFCGFGIGPANQIVVNPRGSIAWVAWDRDRLAEVWRVDGTGRRRLAHGEDVDPNFLRRRNDLIEWRQAGSTRRDTLEP